MNCFGLYNCCGVYEVGDWDEGDDEDDFNEIIEELGYENPTGMCISTFVNTPPCHYAYNYIVKHFKVLYQSPPKRNPSSGNDVFILIYDVLETV